MIQHSGGCGPRSVWAMRAMRVTIRGLPDGITGAEVAAALGCSPNHFYTRFHREAGLPFGSWLRQVRVRRALRELRRGASVLEAALAVGYADSRGLQRAFRLEIGRSPSSAKRAWPH